MTETQIEDYCDYLIRTGKSSAAKSYRGALNGFNAWLEEKGQRNLDNFTFQDAELYMHEGFESPRTANNFKVALVGLLRHNFVSTATEDPSYTMRSQKFNQIKFLKNRKNIRTYEKVSLEVNEVKEFLKNAEKTVESPVYSLAVLLAYFGARPIELESNIAYAKIDFDDRSMIIKTAKTEQPRFLCWTEVLDDHVETVYHGAPFPYCGEYFTKTLKYQQKKRKDVFKNDVVVTAKTFRKTFQTQERLLGVPDLFIDAVMGHENSGSKMGNVYTDYTSPMFMEKIREVLSSDQHYMIKNGII